MTKTLLVILIVCQLQSFAQELKKQRTDDETFYVLKNDESTKHGSYVKKWSRGVIEKGQYDMNKKVGVWEFYGLDGKMEQQFNYSDSVLVSDNSVKPIYTLCLVTQDSAIMDVSPDKFPVFIGGTSKFYRHLFGNLRYPPLARRRGTQGKVLISGTVTKTGAFTNAKIFQDPGDGCGEEALRVVNLFEFSWLPAIYNSEKTDVMIVIPVVFKLN
jgi:TonB family protein